MTVRVEIWSDIACPWCYIGKRRFGRALDSFDRRDEVEVVWRSFELDPGAEHSHQHPGRTEAQLLAERKGLPVVQVQQMFEQVTRAAAGEGLSYDFDRVVPASTFDAHRLVHIAGMSARTGAAAELVERLMSAHFEHGRVVDDVEELTSIAAEAGLDAAAVRAALDAGEGSGAVRADEAEAAALGVTGVPFFVADRRIAVSGAQPTEVFTEFLTRALPAPTPAFVTVPTAGEAEVCGPEGC